ncbi:SRPBCC family protein [Demequina sp. SO4-13]|uniref:SRPBCC family protein n=1 Tax=Demequina sp. SO4-13 TaxID=3401027 RepID=UPI003AF5F6A2
MAVSTVHAERDIKADPRVVWSILTDLDGAPDVLSGVVAVERLEGEGYEVGVKWRETRRMLGKEASEEMWVVAVEEPFTTTVSAESGGTRYATVFVCEPIEGGTRLSVDFGGESVNPGLGQRIGWALFGKIGLKSTQKALVKDLEDIAKAAEKRPTP